MLEILNYSNAQLPVSRATGLLFAKRTGLTPETCLPEIIIGRMRLPHLVLAVALLPTGFDPILYAQPRLTVDAGSGQHPINPWIYGINTWQDNGLQKLMRIPLVRWGGDDATSYNWQTGTKNNTGDNPWVYENYTVKPGFDPFHETNLRTGTTTLGTVSLMDWSPGTPHACSFSVAKYGKQKAVAPDNSDCGNGVLLSGAMVANDPNDAYVPVTPDFSRQWIRYISGKYGPAVAGGVRLWSLDNEPEWWDSNHYDVYPRVATYDDTMARHLTWAGVVKDADPAALVTGPVPGGWSGMLFSKKDMTSGWSAKPYQYWDNPVDQKAHGGLPWVVYYLQQMKAAEARGGKRLLDVLDVHAYIAPGALSGSAGDAAMEKLRLTSTRAFWDPNYIVPGGQIWDATGKEVAPHIVPQLKQWVNDNYPGTLTGITEYNWGAQNNITGAVAQADILGIFGREGLDIATIWATIAPTDPGAFAFKIFLNYDGVGGRFGDTSVSATTDDADTLSIFAARRSDSALTVLVLNKTPNAISDSIGLAGFAAANTAQVWQYSGANLKAIVKQPDLAVSVGALQASFPGYSMTLIVIPQAAAAMGGGQPMITGIRSAASYDDAGVAPGEIVAIFGQGLGPAQVQNLQLDPNGLLATSLAGTRVLFNGIPAPLIYSFDQQLAAIVPYAVAQLAAKTVQVTVEYQGTASAPFPVNLLAAHPAIFALDYTGSGQGAILNVSDLANCGADLSGCRNSPAIPAARGAYVAIYGTGEGVTNVPGVDGRISGTPLPAPALPCSVTIGGQQATVQYCGAAPGATAGLLQVNAVVPAGVAPGPAVPVMVTIGASSSQSTISMAVK